MSILFDPDFGILKQNIQQIVNAKRAYLRDMHGIVINNDPSSIYNIIATSLATIEEQIIDELNSFFSKVSPGGEYFKAIEEHISVKSTTFDAVRSSLLKLKEIEYVNIDSKVGTADIYLILNDSLLNSSKTDITDSTFKAKLWKVLYSTMPVGTLFNGSITIDGLNTHNQLKSYKISLGKKKYVYLKVKYQLDLKNHIYLNIDMQIRDIYKRIVTNNYPDMGISFEYQDFIAPVNEIKGIKSMKIYACIKDTDDTKIASITDSEFKENTNIEVKPEEILIFNLTDRLIIDITT
ncbi:Hypothetical protein BHY_0936 (plasmid) [Borrelia nietonii YOR]|uniref:Uncharacterized protein n=2 Tax=Borrelia TaxID=138 RepID=W5SAA2_9SPIR|nr:MULTISPECIES: DUF276 domain-containing protein [Borrelia]AHH03887.1 Hypothetical protein BHY_0936 [Borrelia nietonii YOR]AHH14419.1 Hypothetical protein BHW_0008300 [Borrelia hermsii MTW]UPA09646.1 DUF276 domain-containing protein [Borrelia nietonii YOR]UPA09669.1 DUF276 domain-containing protein [Borrelia nietonii YOR]UPA10143.1 DUF276 domain-containing protein [Borrelia nietonii YOR]